MTWLYKLIIRGSLMKLAQILKEDIQDNELRKLTHTGTGNDSGSYKVKKHA